MLHTVNKSPFTHNSLESCLRYLSAGDALLLLEDGVYAALANSAKSAMIEAVLDRHPVYVLQGDARARGLDRLIEGVQLTDYRGFVKLLETHHSQAWL